MAGLQQTILGADFSAHSAGFLPPVMDGLLGWWFFGGSVAETQQDRAGIANAVLAGSPTIGNGYVSFGGVATGQWLQTAVMETDDITLMVVARSADTFASGAHKPMFVSNYGTDSGSGGALIGSSIYIDGGTAPAGTVRFGSGQNNAGSYSAHISTTFNTTDVSTWNFYSAKVSQPGGAGSKKLTNGTTGQTSTAVPNYPRRSNTIRAFRFGASHDASFGGICDLSWGAIYGRFLTDDQEEAIKLSVRARLAAKHGIIV